MKKKREKIKGRAAAILSMVLMIAVSVPLGMGISLVRERNEVTAHYYGSDSAFSYTFGLLEDLASCSNAAANFVTLGGKYLSADDAVLTDLQDAARTLTVAERPGEKAAAYTALTARVQAMYNTLHVLELSAQDKEYCEEIYADYCSYMSLISYNEYNNQATVFNETLRRAPGRPIAALMGVEELELFA